MTNRFVHATAVAIAGDGVLLTGPSGSGKSDLAFRLIDRGAVLVGDDAVAIDLVDELLVLSPAPNIAGRLEIRGLGIYAVDTVSSIPLRLVAKLDADVDRMPSPDMTTDICDYHVPCVHLGSFEASAPIKIEYALRAIIDAERWPVKKDVSNNFESKGN